VAIKYSPKGMRSPYKEMDDPTVLFISGPENQPIVTLFLMGAEGKELRQTRTLETLSHQELPYAKHADPLAIRVKT